MFEDFYGNFIRNKDQGWTRIDTVWTVLQWEIKNARWVSEDRMGEVPPSKSALKSIRAIKLAAVFR